MRARARTLIEREIAKATRSRRLCDDKRFHADAVIRRYEEALAAVGVTGQTLEYNEGWYTLRTPKGRTNYREADIARKTQALWGTVHAREIQAEGL